MLGFDIFVDSQLKPWVLEINDHPSLNIMLCLEGEKGLIKEPSEVDKFIKVKVIGDAIKLMKKYKTLKERSEVKNYKCWHRLLPDPEVEEFDSFIRAKDVYEALAGRLHAPLSMSQFTKLVKIAPLGKQIQKV